FLIPYLTFFSNKNGWYKYAGNWNQDNPPIGYALQRWMLKKQKRKVTINGRWPNQPDHCLTFENPCLTEKEREEGLQIMEKKSFAPPYIFCFVGRLEDAKGVQRIINAFGSLNSLEKIAAIHFIGSGEKRSLYENECKMLKLPAIFHGFLNREQVFEIYKNSHFILLPSDSEGFPKVIAEAMNFGCIPIVSDVSSIGQYVNSSNGFLVSPINENQLIKVFNTVFSKNRAELTIMASNCYLVASKFTFTKFRDRIKEEIAQFK